MSDEPRRVEIPTFCPLCVSRCGARATVEDGRLVALSPDPSHPTGGALCVKGKAAPEIVYHPRRLLRPLVRTRPKGDTDPGWRTVSWDEALRRTAEGLLAVSRRHGPESVAFSSASPSTSALSDAVDWIQRLRHAFGSPNFSVSMELCGWGRYLASSYTYGAPVPGGYMPDLERAGCILFWGYNPSISRLVHATATADALRRGARLIVVDPRRVGLANRADVWLRVRPGTDGALALALAGVMIRRGWYDAEFVRRWTNGPHLVRMDDGRILRGSDLPGDGDPEVRLAWDPGSDRPVGAPPGVGSGESGQPLALAGEFDVDTDRGTVRCRPAFGLLQELCNRHAPEWVEETTGLAFADLEAAALLLWEHRPVAFYAWSGVEQHTNATQIARAIGVLYALTGSLDVPGGNVLFGAVPTNAVDGPELLSAEQRAKALGLARRPLGPARWEFVTSDDLYRAALGGEPYPLRALVAFGSNLVMAHADSARGRDAIAGLDFHVHADLFMNPTAELADVVLPVTSPFESEGLAVGFGVSEDAQALVQLRRPVIEPPGETRSDIRIVFDLACALGVGEVFWGGDVDAGLRHLLEPSGISLERLRAEPAGVRVPVQTRHRKFSEVAGGAPRGLGTPSGRVELYSEAFLEHGYAPLPEFEEPAMSPRSRPDLAERFPLVLTCAKPLWFCETQHRGIAALRRRAPDPLLEIHPDTAAARGVSEGDWIRIETPHGSVRARARLAATLDPAVVCGQHGWWQGCEEIGEPAYPPYDEEGANLNLLIRHDPADAVSGSAPHRSWMCEVTLLTRGTATGA